MIVGLVILGVILAAVQAAVSPYQWILAYIISVFMYFSFDYVVWVAIVSGVSYSVYRVSVLGGFSLLILGIVGIMQFMTASRSQQASRNMLRDGLFFVPIAVVDAIVKVSARQFVGDIVVFAVVYSIVSYLSRRQTKITVRKSL